MSSVAGQSLAIGNLGKLGSSAISDKPITFANSEKLQMFIERYLELSSELKYKKGQGAAYLQLGEIMSSKGDFNQGKINFYRAMKIGEEVGDEEHKEKAKVNLGMACANLKWEQH